MKALPRSWLFTPGSRPDRFAKAAVSSAQAIILDLEDAVAPTEKDSARSHVLSYVRESLAQDVKIAVRINPPDRVTGLDDLSALARLGDQGPDYIVIPKAEDARELALAARVLIDGGSRAALVPLIESARGVANVSAIAQHTPNIAAFIFGAADYCADLGQQVGVFQADHARSIIVNAAAAGGAVAIDTPFFTIDSPQALETECHSGRALGFYGKAAIHPLQLQVINDTFSPTPEEHELARRVLDAAPDGVGVLDGKMVDYAMVRWAKLIA